jgi:hypothetical protein
VPSSTPIAKKLKIAPDDRFALFGAPPGFAAKVRPAAPGHHDIEMTPGTKTKEADRRIDGALIFVRMARDLETAREAVRSVTPEGLIWIAYPKGGAMETDLNRDVLRESLAKHGLESVSLIALDDTWSAMRFKRSPKTR